jgi:hypothetical protein
MPNYVSVGVGPQSGTPGVSAPLKGSLPKPTVEVKNILRVGNIAAIAVDLSKEEKDIER